MADKKISQLTNATTPLAGTEVLPVVQGGNTVKVSVDNLTAGKTVKAATFDTDIAAAKVTLSGIALAAGGSDTNVNVEINPKGASGSVVVKTSNVFAQPVTTANVAYFRAVNAGGTAYLGLDSSSAGLSTAYALNLWHSGNYPIVFGTNDTQRGRWDTSGNLKIENGNLVVSTAAKGIDFSANTHAAGMTSELLDWYEEGTWTPVPVPTSGSITSYTSSGAYTRIGNAVSLIFNISITDAGTATALSNISGIPFTNGGVVASGAGREAGSTGAMWQYSLAASGTTIAGKKYDNDPGIATGYILYGNLTYFV
jgi:hypothetical protein